MEKIYFGHPITYYNTPAQSKLIKKIKATFPDFDVENPGSQIHEENYRRWEKTLRGGMAYFFIEVLPRMDRGIFLPFEDRMFGAGVFKEMVWLYNEGKKIWEISHQGLILPIPEPDQSRALSAKDTRIRVHPSIK